MGKTLGRPKQRLASMNLTRPGPPAPLQPTELALERYKAQPRDPNAGTPWRGHGDVGSYWTVPVMVPLSELAGLTAIVYNIGRLYRVRMARKHGTKLPPISLGVSRSSRIWLIDGNHRLTEAREVGQHEIAVRFTFAGM